MATFDMKDFARRGAEVRITELQSELEAIFRAFPALRPGGARKVVVNREEQAQGPGGQARSGAGAVEGARKGRKRRKMSAAQRKAVGVRMKKYWAARRAAQGAKKR